MKDAYSGIVNLVFIALFLLVISCILALIVSYTKAFKMKNNVISVIERYEGSGCTCGGTGLSCTETTTECRKRIAKGAKQLGYAPVKIECPTNYDNVDQLYCVKQIYSRKEENHHAKYTYDVVTQVDLNFSLVSKIFGFNVFKISGQTQEIELPTS